MLRGIIQIVGRNNGLGRRLVLLMVMSSAVLSALAAGFQLYLSYDRDRNVALQTFETVVDSFLPSLEKAIWEFNFSQVDALLDGIAAKSAVLGIELEAETGQILRRGDQPMTQGPLTRRYILQHSGVDSKTSPVGELRIALTLQSVHDRLWDQFQALFLSNLAKTMLASVVMLILFHALVARHLRDIAKYVARTDWLRSRGPLALKRPIRTAADDLDDVVRAINQARTDVLKSVVELDHEIVERKGAEQEALRASEAKSAFLATMSHEVRTPINAIMGLLELIGQAEIPDRQRRQAKAAHSSAEALLYQLTNVLEVSKLEAKSIELNYGFVPLSELKSAIQGQMEGALERANRSLSSACDLNVDPDVEVKIELRRTLQITANLIDNASRFTPQGSVRVNIDLLLQSEQSSLCIEVKDTGIGISKEHVDRIFERFVQIEDPITRTQGGSGLGLSISKGLANLMGGDLTVESCIGAGSAFKLQLPIELHSDRGHR